MIQGYVNIMDIRALVERIAFIRTRANLSARKLSLAIGKTDGYINGLEARKNFAPTFETLMAILDACNTTVAEFFYYDIEQYARDKEMIDLFGMCGDEKKSIATAVLRLKAS